jgi:cytoplasmic iron level regulating protein YaaA (DUF328/UPF0246 family)
MAHPLPLILLPPSEGKAPGGDGPAWSPGTMSVDLDDRRARVMAALRSAMRANQAGRAKLLGVKGVALAAATAANRSVATTPTLPAIDRYTGVLYGALDAATLDGAARRRLDDGVLIVSGLWGLVAPGDPIPDYKLKMGASLASLGKLSTWWRPAVDEAISEVLDGEGRGPVWNLLPNEHDAAWSGVTDRPVHTVRFLEPGRGGELVAVSHWNKFLKGALVRHLVEHPGAGPDELAGWEHPAGYVLDPARTAEQRGRVQLDFVRRS